MTHNVTPENSDRLINYRNLDLLAADMLAALKMARDNMGRNHAYDMVCEAIHSVEKTGIRAQSFAERERHLLVANNVLEERARASERRAKALEEHMAESAAAYTSTFISMSRRRRQFREVLKAVIAIAAEKLADMQTFDHAAIAHGREYDPVRTADVAATITAAKVLLGEA